MIPYNRTPLMLIASSTAAYPPIHLSFLRLVVRIMMNQGSPCSRSQSLRLSTLKLFSLGYNINASGIRVLARDQAHLSIFINVNPLALYGSLEIHSIYSSLFGNHYKRC